MKTDVNRVEDLADALVDNMPYADNSVLYPEFDTVKRDDGVFPEWFYPAMSGINDFSELNSILMYTRQNTKFDDIGELLLGIALVEMKHYDKLQDFIKALGGNVDRHYSSTKVETGSTSVEALRVAIKAERAAIAAYHKVQNQLNMKGPCLNRLTNGPYKYRASLKPPTFIIHYCGRPSPLS